MLGIHDLIQGKLSPYLIPGDVLLQILHEVNTNVQRRFSFSVSTMNLQYYYQSVSVVYARQNNSIFFTFSIPITSDHHLFNVSK